MEADMAGNPSDRDVSVDRPPAGVARELLELEAPWSRDFDDPVGDWGGLPARFMGPFLLVLVGAGGAVVAPVAAVRSAGGRRLPAPVSWCWGSSCSWAPSGAPTSTRS